MSKNFSIFGAGGHAKVIIEIVEESGYKVSQVVDNDSRINEIIGYAVTHEMLFTAPVIIAVGNNKTRKNLVGVIKNAFETAIHPKTNISHRCEIGEGTVVMAGVSINSQTVIGKHCIINTNASVDHDCQIADFVHISPNASLAGDVTVGEGSHIGIGSTVVEGKHIGKWATIGAGAVVLEDVPDYAVVVGVPGRIIRYNPS